MADKSVVQTVSNTGLGSFDFVITKPGAQLIDGKLILPRPTDGAPSQVVVTVAANGGSAFYTGQPGATTFHTGEFAAVGDVWTVTLSSNAAVDQGLNVIKSVVSLSNSKY